jgi:hypothetical protein
VDNPLKGLVPYQADVRGKLPPAQVETPDYEDRNLRRSLTNFLAALGKEGDAWFHMTAVTIGEINLPTKQRCILKGFESGEMIGVPPAVRLAAKEQEWQELPMSPVQWQWRPYFIALVVVEPKGLELRRR